ncbi:MAG TPA: ATP-grasp domain-containing protein [Candidatus Polarisedimenticolia bacterium]|nr:ATP-grasp domain-containing protein [Candidatus Polarisedimenticolia bacterium]
MRILVYEHFTHLGRDGAAAPLFRSGRAMWRAVARDLGALRGVRVASPPAGAPRRILGRSLQAVDAALIIAPESQGTLERLAVLARRRGALLLGAGPRSVRLAADKRRCGRMLRAAGISVPLPAAGDGRAGSGSFLRREGVIVVKPRRGCGSEGVVVARGAAGRRRAHRIAAAAAGRDGVVAEEFVAGPAGSASFLVRAGRTTGAPGDLLFLGLGRQRITGRDRSRAGAAAAVLEYRGGSIPWAPRQRRAAAAAARAAVLALARAGGDLRGFVGVDFVVGPRGPVVVEINPRLTSSYLGLRRLYGRALVRAMLAAGRGDRLPRRLAARGCVRFHAAGEVRYTCAAVESPRR